ncbi:MAG: hypothetical protein LBN07_00165 [Christensenellaceae bacterium]|jgi:hypothetical protein|nr:hypothetical protein [Christensenellaceae bacterium]
MISSQEHSLSFRLGIVALCLAKYLPLIFLIFFGLFGFVVSFIISVVLLVFSFVLSDIGLMLAEREGSKFVGELNFWVAIVSIIGIFIVICALPFIWFLFI